MRRAGYNLGPAAASLIEHEMRNIIKMASELGFRVVAEGVETRKVYDFLRETQCSAVQGYLISRPLPADALLD